MPQNRRTGAVARGVRAASPTTKVTGGIIVIALVGAIAMVVGLFPAPWREQAPDRLDVSINRHNDDGGFDLAFEPFDDVVEYQVRFDSSSKPISIGPDICDDSTCEISLGRFALSNVTSAAVTAITSDGSRISSQQLEVSSQLKDPIATAEARSEIAYTRQSESEPPVVEVEEIPRDATDAWIKNRMSELRATDGISGVGVNGVGNFTSIRSDNNANPQNCADGDWYQNAANVLDVPRDERGHGASVAVIDGGFDLAHPAFDEADISSVDVNGTTRSNLLHGIGPASLIVGGGTGGRCDLPVGVAPAVTVEAYDVSGRASDVAAAIVEAVNRDVDVINLSYALPCDILNVPTERFCPYHILGPAIDYADRSGVVVVAAAGNDGAGTLCDKPQNRDQWPAKFNSVIAVGGSTRSGQPWDCSPDKSYIDILAPAQYLTIAAQQGYGFGSGTSLAAAFISGIAATVLAEQPDMPPSQIRKLISASGDSRGVFDASRVTRESLTEPALGLSRAPSVDWTFDFLDASHDAITITGASSISGPYNGNSKSSVAVLANDQPPQIYGVSTIDGDLAWSLDLIDKGIGEIACMYVEYKIVPCAVREYVSGSDEEVTWEIIGVSALTGSIEWRRSAGRFVKSGDTKFSNVSPYYTTTFQDGATPVLVAFGHLIRLNLDTGAVDWSAKCERIDGTWDVSDKLLVLPCGAFRIDTGKNVPWLDASEISEPGDLDHIVVDDHLIRYREEGDTLVVEGVDQQDGETLWSRSGAYEQVICHTYEECANVPSQHLRACSPWYGEDGEARRDPECFAVASETPYFLVRNRNGSIRAFDPSNGVEVWTANLPQGLAIASDTDYVIQIREDGTLVGHSWAKGTQAWKSASLGKAMGFDTPSGGVLPFLDDTADLAYFEKDGTYRGISERTGEQLWEADLGPGTLSLVGDNTLLVGAFSVSGLSNGEDGRADELIHEIRELLTLADNGEPTVAAVESLHSAFKTSAGDASVMREAIGSLTPDQVLRLALAIGEWRSEDSSDRQRRGDLLRMLQGGLELSVREWPSARATWYGRQLVLETTDDLALKQALSFLLDGASYETPFLIGAAEEIDRFERSSAPLTDPAEIWGRTVPYEWEFCQHEDCGGDVGAALMVALAKNSGAGREFFLRDMPRSQYWIRDREWTYDAGLVALTGALASAARNGEGVERGSEEVFEIAVRGIGQRDDLDKLVELVASGSAADNLAGMLADNIRRVEAADPAESHHDSFGSNLARFVWLFARSDTARGIALEGIGQRLEHADLKDVARTSATIDGAWAVEVMRGVAKDRGAVKKWIEVGVNVILQGTALVKVGAVPGIVIGLAGEIIKDPIVDKLNQAVADDDDYEVVSWVCDRVGQVDDSFVEVARQRGGDPDDDRYTGYTDELKSVAESLKTKNLQFVKDELDDLEDLAELDDPLSDAWVDSCTAPK